MIININTYHIAHSLHICYYAMMLLLIGKGNWFEMHSLSYTLENPFPIDEIMTKTVHRDNVFMFSIWWSQNSTKLQLQVVLYDNKNWYQGV